MVDRPQEDLPAGGEELATLFPTDAYDPLPWAVFLAALAEFCGRNGWVLEYETVDDELCAI